MLLPGLTKLGRTSAPARSTPSAQYDAARWSDRDRPVDVSIGIASYPQHTQSDSLLRAADAALYRAKELGRSRIVSFGRLKTS